MWAIDCERDGRMMFRVDDVVEAIDYVAVETPIVIGEMGKVAALSQNGAFLRLEGRQDFVRATCFALIQRPISYAGRLH